MRPATEWELNEWFKIIAKRDGCSVGEVATYDARAFVLDGYTTDGPGYQEPVGIIIWPGSPNWITQFEMQFKRSVNDPAEAVESRWIIGFDSVRYLEGDPRGDFARIVDEVQKATSTDTDLGMAISACEPNDDWASELMDTGSVTVQLGDKKLELTLHVKEILE